MPKPLRERRPSLPTRVSAAHTKPLPVIRLACFYECLCDEFESNESHLSIATKKSELHESNGVAISYAWGEFDREPRVLGHWSGRPTHAASIILGAEWRVSSFKRRLFQLTAKYGACWIDQFCMPQAEEKIRKTLAAVPSIYETLPVVAFLPGSLCKCLRQAAEEYRDAELAVAQIGSPGAKTDLDLKKRNLEVCLDGTSCLNSNGSSSWVNRLWTCQEYLGSTEFSVLYINEATAPCFLANEPASYVDQLNDYHRHAYRKLVNEQSLAHAEALNIQVIFNADFKTGLQIQGAQARRNGDGDLWLTRLLLGEATLPEDSSDEKRPPESSKLFWNLIVLATMGRKTTKEIDCILSTWISWPHYSIPSDYHNLTAAKLLEDAMYQYHQKHSRLVLSRSPFGLLGGVSCTASWDSSSSREGTAIRDSTDVLGVLTWENALQTRNPGRIAMKLLPSTPESLGMGAGYFSEWRQGDDIFIALHRVLDIIDTWDVGLRKQLRRNDPFYVASKFVPGLLSVSPKMQLEGLTALITTRALHTTGNRSGLDQLRDTLLKLPIQMLEDTLYEMACDAIRVDSRRFREKEVRLVFSEWHGRSRDDGNPIPLSGTCVGFVNGPLFDKARSARCSLLTVAVTSDPDLPFYEAVKLPAQPNIVSEYAVIGIWLPFDRKKKRINEIGAIMVDDSDEHDAVII